MPAAVFTQILDDCKQRQAEAVSAWEPKEMRQLGAVTLLALASIMQHLGKHRGKSAKAGRLIGNQESIGANVFLPYEENLLTESSSKLRLSSDLHK